MALNEASAASARTVSSEEHIKQATTRGRGSAFVDVVTCVSPAAPLLYVSRPACGVLRACVTVTKLGSLAEIFICVSFDILHIFFWIRFVAAARSASPGRTPDRADALSADPTAPRAARRETDGLARSGVSGCRAAPAAVQAERKSAHRSARQAWERRTIVQMIIARHDRARARWPRVVAASRHPAGPIH